MISNAAYRPIKNKYKPKSCKERVCENGSPISDRGGSLFRIGNVFFLINVIPAKGP
jgi:hypothetical protein